MATTPDTKQIRMMHIVNLMSIAYADGNISEDENDMLVRIAQDLELTEEEFDICIEHWKQTDENKIPIAVPESDDEQVEFMKHFALVMMIDGEIEENERNFLAYIVDQFGYNPEMVVPKLIEDVYEEYFTDGNETDDEDEDDDEEEEDPLFGDTNDEFQLDMGKMKLEDKHVEEAFDYLFLPALRNDEAQAYFLIIPNTATRLYRLSDEQMAKVREACDRDFPLAHYVMGRYHQVVKPDEDSLEMAWHHLGKAVEGGIADARWALALNYMLGYNGPVDWNEYNSLVHQAFENGSMQAFKQQLHDSIHGLHGNKAEPKKAIKVIEAFLEQDDTNAAMYPDLYGLLGDAYRRVGNKDKADKCYEQASNLGFFEAGAHRFQNKVEGPDRDFYRETLSFLLDFACGDNDPNSFLARALEHAYHYDKDGKKAELAEKLREDLETACRLGNGDAAYYMGLYSYTGAYAFTKDPQEAWQWFSRGMDMESGLAFSGIAQMIEDGIHPSGLPDGYLERCRLFAKLRGVGEQDEENNAQEISTIFIVSPEGIATVYKLEKEEWHKLANFIGAKRLAPIRLDTLDAIGRQADLTNHLVAWIDIDAPRKGLPQNKVASLFYPGTLCGNIVFSQADNIYDPMPFYGIDEAEGVIKALKAECTDGVQSLGKISNARPKHADYSKVNPLVDKGFVARIEPDGKAHVVGISLAVFALTEEDIYDPVRLKKVHDLGKKAGLKGNITLWIDNSALRKQMVMYDKITPNPIGKKHIPGPVADNLFVAMEDDNCHIMLFDDAEQARQACIALGVKPENIVTDNK